MTKSWSLWRKFGHYTNYLPKITKNFVAMVQNQSQWWIFCNRDKKLVTMIKISSWFFVSVQLHICHQEFLCKTRISCKVKKFLSFQDFLVFPRFSWLSKIFLIFQEYLYTRYEALLHMMSSRISCKDKNFLQSQEILIFLRFSCLSKIFLTFQDFLDFPRISWHQMWSYSDKSWWLIFIMVTNIRHNGEFFVIMTNFLL